jgi:hypothetical protein
MTAYTVAQSRPDGSAHLSADGKFTLCHWRIRGGWLVFVATAPLSALSFYGAHQCPRAAAPPPSLRRQNNCHRCGVLLARAPAAGRGDICGWCEMEKPQ